MSTRKETLFNARKRATDSNMIPSTVTFRHNKKKALLEQLEPHEKMLCALRKVLTEMSETNEEGCSYFLPASKPVQLTKVPTSTAGKKGAGRSYHARGRCRVGLCHPGGHSSSIVLEFEISYRDVLDDRGLADIEYFDPTVIDQLPGNTPIDVSAIA